MCLCSARPDLSRSEPPARAQQHLPQTEPMRSSVRCPVIKGQALPMACQEGFQAPWKTLHCCRSPHQPCSPSVAFGGVKPGSAVGMGAPCVTRHSLPLQPLLKGVICQLLESTITEASAFSVEKKKRASFLAAGLSPRDIFGWQKPRQASLPGESPGSTMRPGMRMLWAGVARK